MKKIVLLISVITLFALNCGEEKEELFFSHLFGYIRRQVDSTGVNDLLLRIRDIDPDDYSQARERSTTTTHNDSLNGFFEMDSVLYGTSKMQGVGYVIIIVDSLDNPGWLDTSWFPDIVGPVDTVEYYIED